MKIFSHLADSNNAFDQSQTKLQGFGDQIYGQGQAASHSNLAAIIGGIVKAAIGTLGIIFVVLIVYAGFLWMTARGEEDKVTKAKDTIQRSVIGLVIVIAAYAIASFVISRVTGITAPPSP